MEELGNGVYISDSGRKRTRYSRRSAESKAKQVIRKKKWMDKNPERALLMNTKNRAKTKNIPFNLTLEDIKIPEYCPVLGIKLSKGTGRPASNSPSIDKIIPSLGYTKGNIIIVSYRANMIKTDATYEEILNVGTFYKNLIEGQRKAAQIKTLKLFIGTLNF